jgi:hypothetical protein
VPQKVGDAAKSPIDTESPEYFTDVIRRDFEKWGKLARDIGFKPR